MATVTYQRVVADCELLELALEPLLTEFPHLSAEHTELVEFLVRIKELNQLQSALKGQFRQTVRLRQEAELDGMDLRLRVATQLRGKLGFTNEQLAQFGLTPRRRPRRRPQDESPPPGEDPPGEEPEEPESPPVE